MSQKCRKSAARYYAVHSNFHTLTVWIIYIIMRCAPKKKTVFFRYGGCRFQTFFPEFFGFLPWCTGPWNDTIYTCMSWRCKNT